MTSTIQLSDALVERIDEMVGTGDYASREAVIEAAIEGAVSRSAWQRNVETSIAQGLADIDAGRVHTIEEVRAHFRDRARNQA